MNYSIFYINKDKQKIQIVNKKVKDQCKAPHKSNHCLLSDD